MGFFENMNLLLLTAGCTESVLQEQISLYSAQLEEYDRTCINFVLTCIGFAGVIFGIIATLLNIQKNKQNNDSSQHTESRVIEKVIAVLILIVPSMMTLCLYVFSMQCRRVAFFRGYLKYLEERLSERMEVPLLFNTKIVEEYFGKFTTNRIGPVVMGVFIAVILLISLLCSLYYAKAFWNSGIGGKVVYILLFVLLPLFCIAACAVFTVDLSINDSIVKSVYEYCIDSAGG